jgi:hypothetical protein
MGFSKKRKHIPIVNHGNNLSPRACVLREVIFLGMSSSLGRFNHAAGCLSFERAGSTYLGSRARFLIGHRGEVTRSPPMENSVLSFACRHRLHTCYDAVGVAAGRGVSPTEASGGSRLAVDLELWWRCHGFDCRPSSTSHEVL